MLTTNSAIVNWGGRGSKLLVLERIHSRICASSSVNRYEKVDLGLCSGELGHLEWLLIFVGHKYG